MPCLCYFIFRCSLYFGFYRRSGRNKDISLINLQFANKFAVSSIFLSLLLNPFTRIVSVFSKPVYSLLKILIHSLIVSKLSKDSCLFISFQLFSLTVSILSDTPLACIKSFRVCSLSNKLALVITATGTSAVAIV